VHEVGLDQQRIDLRLGEQSLELIVGLGEALAAALDAGRIVGRELLEAASERRRPVLVE